MTPVLIFVVASAVGGSKSDGSRWTPEGMNTRSSSSRNCSICCGKGTTLSAKCLRNLKCDNTALRREPEN